MLITLSPVRMSPAMTLVRHGDVLTINGEVFDFSALPEGAYTPAQMDDLFALAVTVAV